MWRFYRLLMLCLLLVCENQDTSNEDSSTCSWWSLMGTDHVSRLQKTWGCVSELRYSYVMSCLSRTGQLIESNHVNRWRIFIITWPVPRVLRLHEFFLVHLNFMRKTGLYRNASLLRIVLAWNKHLIQISGNEFVYTDYAGKTCAMTRNWWKALRKRYCQALSI